MAMNVEGEVMSIAEYQRNGPGPMVTSVPPGYAIRAIYFHEMAGNAVIGGINIGTTTNAADVVAAFALGANGFVGVPPQNILKRAFSAVSPQTLYLSAPSNWNYALVSTVIYLDCAVPQVP